MELVIQLDDELYSEIKSYEYPNLLEESIIRGTSLPKGHGRLIDADSIHQIIRPIEQSDDEWGMTAETAIQLIHSAFNRASTIIEADKE